MFATKCKVLYENCMGKLAKMKSLIVNHVYGPTDEQKYCPVLETLDGEQEY